MEPLKQVQVEGYLMVAEPELLFGNLDELCCVSTQYLPASVELSYTRSVECARLWRRVRTVLSLAFGTWHLVSVSSEFVIQFWTSSKATLDRHLAQSRQIHNIAGLEKSRLKLNLCQPVAFINLSRFKPAFINKSRLKFRINEITENHSSKE